MLPLDKISAAAEEMGITLPTDALPRFALFAALVTKWNRSVNLTAITQPEEMAIRHFVDSLTVLSAFTPKTGAQAADVGTGAGFPGVVLLIARPDLKVTLIDSLQKRLNVVALILKELGLSADLVHTRAEDAGRESLRERFDLVTARAVGELRVLSELCLPLCAIGGIFAAMKGPNIDAELAAARSHIGCLGGGQVNVKPFILPDCSERNIILIKKSSQTPTGFPRPISKINRKK